MPPTASEKSISGLMAYFRKGDKQAASERTEIFCPLLRLLTAQVNELYLELVKIKAPQSESILAKLEQVLVRLRSIVELEVFEAMTVAEVAPALHSSTAPMWSLGQSFPADRIRHSGFFVSVQSVMS